MFLTWILENTLIPIQFNMQNTILQEICVIYSGVIVYFLLCIMFLSVHDRNVFHLSLFTYSNQLLFRLYVKLIFLLIDIYTFSLSYTIVKMAIFVWHYMQFGSIILFYICTFLFFSNRTSIGHAVYPNKFYTSINFKWQTRRNEKREIRNDKAAIAIDLFLSHKLVSFPNASFEWFL